MRTAVRPQLGLASYRCGIGLVAGFLLGIGMSAQRTWAQDEEAEPAEPADPVAVEMVVEVDGQVVDMAVAEEAGIVMGMAMKAEDMSQNMMLRYANRERGFIRRACSDLSEEQLTRLQSVNEQWIKKELEGPKGKQGDNAVLRGIGRFLGGDRNAVQVMVAGEDGSEHYKRVRTAIDAEFNAILNEEQKKILDEEKRQRDEFRREATAAVMVSALDNHVYMSQPQREELIDGVKDWIAKKNLYWQFYFQNSAYAPDIPVRVMNKSLTKDQQRALSGLNRYNYEMDEFYIESNGMVPMIEFKDR